MPQKHFILLHGTSGNPDNFWFPWLAHKLESHGHRVSRPQLPNADRADLSEQTPFVLDTFTFDAHTVLIGHSAGVPLALNVLQSIDAPIHRAVLVAGFAQALPEMPPDHQTLLQHPNWDKIRANCPLFTMFHSDNDPWGCDHHQGEFLRTHLGGTLIVMSGHGHFGSAYFNQPYTDFPLLAHMALA